MFSLSQLIETALSNLLYFALHLKATEFFQNLFHLKRKRIAFKKPLTVTALPETGL